ncbi:MAG: DEAD/DEAH box helicase [Patescibacteria group bacterium]
MSTTNLDEQNKEFSKAIDLMDNSDNHIFLTGEAGTGKSTLLKNYVASTFKDVVVLAPTGLAAINARGQTIHKFCLLPPRFILPEDVQVTKNPVQKKLIKNIQTIIIDEVSMVRADQMDAIDRFLRINRGKNIPFGGVQMIFVGDLFQLPPVVRREDSSFFNQLYSSPYFFSAPSFSNLNIRHIELTKNYRQINDQDFLRILNQVKQGLISDALLGVINSRFVSTSETGQENYINLTSTNQLAYSINTHKLGLLKAPEIMYQAVIEGDFRARDCQAEELLILKEQAHIMFIRNDSQGRWVNGTTGIVTKLDDQTIVVRLDSGKEYEVEPEKWENIKFVYNEEENRVESKVLGSMTQYPVKLAWAVTIHKSQGQTFDQVMIDLGRGAFSHGQTYVALSRSRTLKGIRLKRKLSRSDFIVDQRVVSFMKSIQTKAALSHKNGRKTQ